MMTLISSFFRTFIIIHLYKNLLMPQTSRIKYKHLNYLILIVLFIFSSFVQKFFPHLLPIISIPLFTLYVYIIYKNKIDLSFAIISISYAIYYVSFNIISLIITVLYTPFYYFNIDVPYDIVLIINGILTYLTIRSLFKIKRIKLWLSQITNKKFINFSLIICFLILSLKTADSLYINSSTNLESLPLATFLLAILLFTWWRRQITKSYIEKLRKLEIQSLYDELTEKEEQIKKLTGDNEALSRIVHKDNKLIPAMEHLVSEFLSDNDFNNPEDLKQYGSNLTKQLHDMTRDRRGILENYEHGNHKLKLTGHVALDAILVYMQKKAEDQNILFECKHNEDSLNYLLSKISEEDLSHLLSDFLENAIISMRETGNGRLQVTFGKLQKEAYIAIADTGSDFELSTLHSFGISPNTTHGNDGGSGIGLMDIWKLKRKYRATIQIQEYEKNSNTFTKRILFSFNSKNHYVIQSYRHTEISNNQTRGDLCVIPMDTVRKNEDKEYERNDQNLNS